MKLVTVRDFRDRASEMLRSDDIILVTRDGRPAGFFLPWHRHEIPDEIRKGLYAELSARAREHLAEHGVGEEEILSDFRAARRSRR